MTTRLQSAQARWQTAKPLAIAFAAGLLIGPFASNYVGWQVTSRTSQAAISAGIIEQQALFCAARARADVAAPEALGWEARYDLAKKWSTMPGGTEPAAGVASACASKLAA
ncbi:MAG TPA: hypothetical protein VET85_15310 [Stellaceae bacterium]|nr:hypothetical protein [Stellaceae bacterium]